MYEGTLPGTRSPRRKAGRFLGILAFGAACCVFAWGAWNVWAIVSEDMENSATVKSMQAYAQLPADPGAGQVSEDGSLRISGVINPVDFDGLLAVNPDVVGWIYIPDTEINHVIVQGADNEYYLHHGPDKSDNRSGSIFMDASNNGTFDGMNTVLFGHRMNNGSMFAGLHAFEDKEFLQSHPYVYIYTPDGGMNTYRIYEVAEGGNLVSDPAYVKSFDEEAFAAWGSQPVGKYYWFEDPQLTAEDKVLTLSTCVRDNGAKRFIVRAKLESRET